MVGYVASDIGLVVSHGMGDPSIDAAEMMSTYRPHRPSDDISLPFDYEIGAEFTDLIRTIVLRIADADTSPHMNEGDPLSR